MSKLCGDRDKHHSKCVTVNYTIKYQRIETIVHANTYETYEEFQNKYVSCKI